METYTAKQALRKDMASRKKEYSRITLCELSDKIMDRLEQTELFQAASCIALYHAIPGEVQTAGFIEKWYQKKKLLLPLIVGDDLRLLLYEGPESLKPGPFGILEPKADGIEVPKKDKNRMGRGRGFYDRLLSTLNAPKVGICFGFQMIPQVPVEPLDKKMDYVITEDPIY